MKKFPFLVFAFLLVMLDSMINYFIATFSAPIPINFLVPIFLICSLIQHGPVHLTPKPYYSILILGFVAACSLAIITAPGTSQHRILELLSAMAAFITGYSLFKNVTDERTIARLFLLIGWLYVAICCIALLKLLPAYFPIKSGIWSLQGTLIERPEVTTDQNFQIFYLMPIVPLLALPFQPLRFFATLTGLVGAIFVLAQLQTRSGVLVIISLVMLAILLPLQIRSLGKMKLLPIIILGSLATVAAVPIIHQFGAILLERFFNTDYSTGRGRLESFLYLFEKLIDPNFWIPRGNQEFLLSKGDVAHSNITAAFLEGGIIGLITWILLMLVPLWSLWRRFWKRQIDHAGCLVLIMGTGMMITQLSLNVPFVDQIWLWGGSVIGVLSRNPIQRATHRTNDLKAPSNILGRV